MICLTYRSTVDQSGKDELSNFDLTEFYQMPDLFSMTFFAKLIKWENTVNLGEIQRGQIQELKPNLPNWDK